MLELNRPKKELKLAPVCPEFCDGFMINDFSSKLNAVQISQDLEEHKVKAFSVKKKEAGWFVRLDEDSAILSDIKSLK